jgi:polyhydroxyalkanoate synthesis repressor PhaR
MAKKSVVIKKYENRRLYDTTNSRYVNLEEVAQLLQQGNDVQVLDAASGEDITRLILTQIIVEDAKAADSNFPLDLLRQMVVASGRASQESALKYMKAMLDMYQSTYRAMPNPFDFMPGVRAGQENAGDGKRAAGPENRPPANGESPRPKDPTEVQDLKGRVAELEKLVSTLVAEKTKGKPTPKRK